MRSVMVAVAMLCAGVAHAEDDKTIVIGSKNFTESRLLAEMMAQLIEAKLDITVERRPNLGGTIVAFTALKTGEIDMYPEYTGTAWAVQLGYEERVSDPLRVFLTVSREFDAKWNLRWLPPFGFNNSYAIAMSEEAAERLGVTRVSELVEHQETLRAGVSHEFLERADGFPGLAKLYGLTVADLKGMEHGLAYEAIRTGKIDIVDAYTTDGKLLRYKIRLLEDDKRYFPPYDAAPVVRLDTLERHPELEPLLLQLAFTLDDAEMRKLNYRVEEEGGAFERVAHDHLVQEGLLGAKAGSAMEPALPSDVGFAGYMWSRRAATADLIAEHLWLTLVAVLLAILVSVPMGVLLTRFPPLASPVLGAAGVIQTLPSLALLAFMIPVPGLGLGARSAIAALFLYALLPIVRNTYTGIKEVQPDLLEAAEGMGLTRNQTLRLVELPLATRTIMAGIRTSTVISVGVATLAAFIGAGGLGDPIVTGLQLNDTRLILSGAVPAAALALFVDFALGRLELALSPKGVD